MVSMSLFLSPQSECLIMPSFMLSIALLGFSDTLRYILLMDAQNKSRQSTDAHRHGSKLWWLDAESWVWFPGKELGEATIAARNKC